MDSEYSDYDYYSDEVLQPMYWASRSIDDGMSYIPAGSPLRKAAEKNHIQNVPVEVMLRIWCYVGAEYDLSSLSRVCKSFYAFSKNPHVVATYFLDNHYPHSIFRAAHFSKKFTIEVFEQLVRSGAPLSRNFVQELGRARFGGNIDNRYGYHRGTYGLWGTQIPFQTCLKIMQEGNRLFGDDISFLRNLSDEDLVVSLTSGNVWTAWQRSDTQIREIFDKGRFIPLVGFRHGQDRGGALQLAKVVARYPAVLPLALRNGWSPGSEDERDATVRQMMLGGDRSGYWGDRNETMPQKIIDKIEQLHQLAPSFSVTTKVASQILNTVLEEGCRPNGSELRDGFLRQAPISPGYDALVSLHRQGSLEIELPNIVEATLRRAWKRKWPLEAFKTLQRIARDFPGLGSLLATPLLHSLCMYVQDLGKPTTDVMGELDFVNVSATTVSNVLLARGLNDVSFLWEVSEQLDPPVDLAATAKTLLPKILCQPSRGKMLASLNGRVSGLAAVLEDAIMAQDFNIQDLPSPGRYPALRSFLFQLPPGNIAPNAPYCYSTRSSLTSVLSYEGTEMGASYTWSASGRSYATTSYRSFDSIFFNFWKLNGRSPPGGCERCSAGAASQDDLIRGNPVFGLSPTEEGDVVASSASKKVEKKLSKWAYPCGASENGMQSRFDDSGYSVASAPNTLSLECIRILGPFSPASSVVLTHAIINYWSKSNTLLESLVTAMHPVGFDLGHWYLLAWLGSSPPSVMIQCILFGLPFSLDGNFQFDPERDPYLLGLKKRSVTAKEKKIAVEQAEPDETSGGSSETDDMPRFNASRDRTANKEFLIEAANGSMAWSAPFMTKAGLFSSEKKSDDQIEVLVNNSNYQTTKIFLYEGEVRRRHKSIVDWIEHLEGLLLLAKKVVALEKHVAKIKKNCSPRNIYKTDFIRQMEGKRAGSIFSLLKSTETSLRRAVEELDKRETKHERFDMEKARCEASMELSELTKELKDHGVEPSDQVASGTKRRRAASATKARRKSKRVRVAEDDLYEDSADETFKPDDGDDEEDEIESLCGEQVMDVDGDEMHVKEEPDANVQRQIKDEKASKLIKPRRPVDDDDDDGESDDSDLTPDEQEGEYSSA